MARHDAQDPAPTDTLRAVPGGRLEASRRGSGEVLQTPSPGSARTMKTADGSHKGRTHES